MRRRSSFSMAGRPADGGSPNRIQARSGGRYARNPSLGAEICTNDACRAIILPLPPGSDQRFPETCHRCGTILVFETCSFGECTERWPDPVKLFSGGYTPCGAPCVAMTIDTRRPRCAEHVEES